MSEKHESEHARHRRCPHCGGCVDHLCRETIAAPAAHQETLRQLAEVTAERDALKRRVGELERERDALAAHAERLTEALHREDLRDPLRKRVEELEDALTIAKTSQDHRLARIRELEGKVRELQTYDQFADL